MPKSDLSLARGEYAPVARRVALFYEAHPFDRILTELVSRTEREVVFRALVFRSPDDRDPPQRAGRSSARVMATSTPSRASRTRRLRDRPRPRQPPFPREH